MKTAFAKYRLRMETPFNILIHKVNKIVFGIQTVYWPQLKVSTV